MDRQFASNTGIERLTENRVYQGATESVNEGTVIFSCSEESETVIPCPSENFGSNNNLASDENAENKNEQTEQKRSFSISFSNSCCISKQNSGKKCESCQSLNQGSESANPSSSSPSTVSSSESQESLKCCSDTGTDILQVTVEELG